MFKPKFFILLSLAFFFACKSFSYKNSLPEQGALLAYAKNKGPLLSTHFNSLDELKSVVEIEYTEAKPIMRRKAQVRLTHKGDGQEVTSILTEGISDLDIKRAAYGTTWKRVSLCLGSPYVVVARHDLIRVFSLGRRRGELFGGGDVAFYDIAENMVGNISEEDIAFIAPKDLSEKGYLNTFNHVTAQALMTTLFSEKLTDFVADTHERGNMSELISGKFSAEQMADVQKGPVDNYVDIINNEWGQELGKVLKKKYAISRQTKWTEELLANYLNDVQSYYSWTLGISFEPFRPDEILLRRFTKKLNMIMQEVPSK